MSIFNLNKDLFARLAGHVGYLNKRHDVLTSNVANLETPGFKSKDLEFKGFLDEAQKESTIYSPDMSIKTNPANGNATGNNVNIDSEMAKMADNSIEFMVTTEVLKKHIGLLKYTISEVK